MGHDWRKIRKAQIQCRQYTVERGKYDEDDCDDGHGLVPRMFKVNNFDEKHRTFRLDSRAVFPDSFA